MINELGDLSKKGPQTAYALSFLPHELIICHITL